MSLNSSDTKVAPNRRWWTIVALPAWVFAGFIAAQLIVSLVVVLLRALGVQTDAINDNVFSAVLAVCIYGIALLFVIGLPLWAKKWRTTRRELGIQRLPSWLDILITPAGLIVYLVFSSLLIFITSQLVPAFDVNQVQDTGFSGLSQQYELILAFITLVILAPIAEEVLFRGYLFGKLRAHIPLWLAIIVTSLLFGAIHGAWNLAIDTFALGVILCILRVTTGSLWAPILLHMTKNGIAFYLLFINPMLLNTMGG